MTRKIYDVNDVVRCSAAFTADDVAVDPTNVFFTVKDPASDSTTYQYGVDGELVKDSTGNYHVDVSADRSGDYAYRFYSTGSRQAGGERRFHVRHTLL